MERTYEIGEFLVGVRTNSKPFARWLDKTFSEYRSKEKVGPMYSVLVVQERDSEGRVGKRFHVLYRESLVLARTFDLREVGQTLRAEFESLLFTKWDDAIYVEAAVLAGKDVAALLPNIGAIALTNITRKVERAGLSVPVGARIAVDPESGHLVPIPPRLAMPDGSIEELARIAPPDGKRRKKASANGHTGVDLVCLLMPGAVDQLLRPVPRALAVKNLVESGVVNLKQLGVRAVEGLARFTDDVDCYELAYKDSEQLFDGLVEAIRLRRPDAVRA